LGWNGTESTITEATTGLLYEHRMMMDDGDCGAIGGITGSGNGSTLRKHAPQDLTRGRGRTAAVESQQLTAWAKALPLLDFTLGLRRIIGKSQFDVIVGWKHSHFLCHGFWLPF
jgi:hypothetical protein